MSRWVMSRPANTISADRSAEGEAVFPGRNCTTGMLARFRDDWNRVASPCVPWSSPGPDLRPAQGQSQALRVRARFAWACSNHVMNGSCSNSRSIPRARAMARRLAAPAVVPVTVNVLSPGRPRQSHVAGHQTRSGNVRVRRRSHGSRNISVILRHVGYSTVHMIYDISATSLTLSRPPAVARQADSATAPAVGHLVPPRPERPVAPVGAGAIEARA